MSLKRVRNATTLNELASACFSAAASIERDINNIVIAASKELSFQLIYKTPVDTSTALSNWQVGLVIPELFPRSAYFYGDEGSTASMSRSAAYAAARAILDTKRAGTRIYISNNADYIVELNNGKSPQQPSPHWVEKIVAKARTDLLLELGRYLNGERH